MRETIKTFMVNHPYITWFIVGDILGTVKYVTKAVATKGDCFYRTTGVYNETSVTNDSNDIDNVDE